MGLLDFLKTEKRESQPFTEAIQAAIFEQASGSAPLDVKALGALASAKITPENPLTRSLTPSILAMIGRELCRRGEMLFKITVSPSGKVRLVPAGSFLPTPDKDGQDDTLALLRGDVRKAKGSMLFVESMADGFQGGSQQVPADWKQTRFGMNMPAAAVELSSMVSREIVSACGVSPTLFDPKSSAAMREAWRQLLFGTVAPLGKIVEAELSAKLFSVSIHWQELRASDLQARARSVDSLVKAGVETARAMEIAGLSI